MPALMALGGLVQRAYIVYSALPQSAITISGRVSSLLLCTSDESEVVWH